MSVREVDEIDYIYLEEPVRRPVLVVSDPLGWKPSEEKQHLELLRLKLNSQIVFISSGQIEKVWPDWDGDDAALVEIAARHALTPRAEDFYAQAQEVMDEAGIGLRFMLLE